MPVAEAAWELAAAMVPAAAMGLAAVPLEQEELVAAMELAVALSEQEGFLSAAQEAGESMLRAATAAAAPRGARYMQRAPAWGSVPGWEAAPLSKQILGVESGQGHLTQDVV